MKEAKFEVVNGWMRCLALFMPFHLTDEEWEKMSIEERDREGNWSKYRFQIEQVYSYNVSNHKGCCRVCFKNSDAMTINVPVHELDKIFEPYAVTP